MFEGDPPSREMAEDPALTAEFLLLLRMVLADGPISQRGLATLRRIAHEAFGIGQDEAGLVVRQLEDFGSEPTTQQTIAAFRELAKDRRLLLARCLVAIARADAKLRAHDARLIARAAHLLGLTPAEMVARPPEAAG